MPKWRPKYCKVCGASVPFVTISQTGLCPTHSRARMQANITAMQTKSGPEWVRYLRAEARQVRRDYLDATADAG